MEYRPREDDGGGASKFGKRVEMAIDGLIDV